MTVFLDMVAFKAVDTAGEAVCLVDAINCLDAADDFDIGFAKLRESLLLFGIVTLLLKELLLEYFGFDVGLVVLVVGGCDVTVSFKGDWYLVGRRITRSGADGRVSPLSETVTQTFSSFRRSRNCICN